MLLIAGSLAAQNPDTLWYENFETGGGSFSLNTADEGGVDAATGYNQWIVNNAYAGGSGSLVCGGFPTTFNVPNTPLQPPGTTGGTSSTYLHMISDAGQASGILNCSYLAANGLCGNNEYNFSGTSLDVSTIGYDSVSISFIWLCAGAPNIYGEMYYSIDGGGAWSLVTVPSSQFINQSTWATRSVSMPVFAQQANLRIGFRFVNEVSFTANDPGFAIDEFLIEAFVAVQEPIAAFTVSDSTICQGSCVSFTDQTVNSPDTWFWVFQGSSTGFSTQQNPNNICYFTPGTYPVTLIVTNASGSDTLTLPAITVYPNPPQPPIFALGDTLVTDPGYVSYEWWLDGLPVAGSDDTLIATMNGEYQVTVTDTNGCSTTSGIFLLNTSLNDHNSVVWSVYPNPAHDLLYIDLNNEKCDAAIFDAIGKQVFPTVTLSRGKQQLDISGLPAGYYQARFSADNGKLQIVKIIKL